MHWLDGADHSFHVTSSGRDDGAVLDEIGCNGRMARVITNPQAADRRILDDHQVTDRRAFADRHGASIRQTDSR